MGALGFFRAKIFGPKVDSVKLVIVDRIESEVSKLNGATQHLAETVQAINLSKPRQTIPDMLDETLRAMDRERQ